MPPTAASSGASARAVRCAARPSVADGTLYVTSQDNQIYSLKMTDGTTNWSNAASLEIAGVFGSASPAIGQGTIVAGFSSGELNAYRYENGRLVWQDALSRTSMSTGVSSLSDIDANPVIDGGQVFAVGQGGRMVALELNSGQRLWELNIAGIATPWVAGDWVYVVTDDAKLIALSRANGKIRWINQLPHYQKEKSKRGQISYVGPVLAGGRLIVAGSNGVLVNVDPGQWLVPEPDQCRRGRQPGAGGRQFDALRARRQGPAERVSVIDSSLSLSAGERDSASADGGARPTPAPPRTPSDGPPRQLRQGGLLAQLTSPVLTGRGSPCPSPSSPSSADPMSASRPCSTASSGSGSALVDDRPGVTRDRREGEASLLGLEFRIIDTAGFEDEDAITLPGRMRVQTEAAVRAADVALFLIDAREGLTRSTRRSAAGCAPNRPR